MGLLKRLFLSCGIVIVSLGFSTIASSAEITGAGASFPFPVYSKWAEAFKATGGASLNYQSIGSSGGIKQIKAKTVDFGATDAPLTFEDLESSGLVQFPAILGGVVPVINLEGFKPGQIKMTGEVLADIYQGVILVWSDKRIAALNPGLNLPTVPITVVHRADGSGTTAIFTNYLSKISPNWKSVAGEGAAIKWPATSSVGGKGNEGVAANVTRLKGAIGYVEWAYAKSNKMTYMQMKNASGNYITPDDPNFAAAARTTDWSKTPGMGIYLTNASGADAWPIAGASFILIYKNPENKANVAQVLKFFEYSFSDTGDKMALDLDYAPLPDNVVAYIKKNVWSQINTK
ncbi:phosphate ABC transporter substrate-binding protein PstS [Polynucleobacter paneuropaeus]|nr:phosphate ABC transporter substrate-binding protein PstS [Polynucleobacter paneuropaeus]MBT8605864.1 phosphate ABC transporter substrate-binding protein PstS [Polynucleobacter paneuropaeus]